MTLSIDGKYWDGKRWTPVVAKPKPITKPKKPEIPPKAIPEKLKKTYKKPAAQDPAQDPEVCEDSECAKASDWEPTDEYDIQWLIMKEVGA